MRVRALLTTVTVTVAATALGSVPAPAHAAETRTWTGAHGASWTDADNWGGSLPAPGDDLVFPAGASTTITTNDFPSGTSFGTISVSGASYSISGNDLRVGAITALSNLAVNAPLTGNLTVTAAAGAAVALNGVLYGSGTLTTAGAGQVQLNAASTLTGVTSVATGSTLFLNGSVNGPVSVQAGGTLAGSGAASGGLTVAAGGLIAPGPSGWAAGEITVGGNLVLERGSTYRTDIRGRDLNDVLRLSGGTFDPSGAALDVTLQGFPSVGSEYTIVSGAGPISGRFAGLPEGGTFQANGLLFQISYAGGQVTITRVARPTATVVVADDDLRAGETSSVTITFSEAVTGFGPEDLTVENGTLGDPASADGGTTWTATLTPSAGVIDDTNVVAVALSGVENAGGVAGAGAATSNTYAVSTVRPTAVMSVNAHLLKIGDSGTVSIFFDEAVSGFTTADLTAGNAVVRDLTSTDGGISWTATLVPTDDAEGASSVVTLDLGGVQNAAGNAGAGTLDSPSYAVDTRRPDVVEVGLDDRRLGVGETSLVTITFAERVRGFTAADIATDLGTVDSPVTSDGGTTWTTTYTPPPHSQQDDVAIVVDLAGVTDLAGNYAEVGSTARVELDVDTLRPDGTIEVADDVLRAGETSLVTITFNDLVPDLATTDLDVANGALSGLSSADGGRTWTATLTPTAGVTDSTNLVALDTSRVHDDAGNAGVDVLESNTYAVSTVRPTVEISLARTALNIGDGFVVTFTFSEPVTGFTLPDLTVPNGTLSPPVSSDGGITWTATLTPAANTTDSTNVITLDTTGVQNASGNTGTGTTDSDSYAVDTVRPTADVTIADTDLRAGETSLVTIAFSEAVTGFDNGDLDVSNGTLSAVSSSDGGTVWTATLTPAEGLVEATNLLVLDMRDVRDRAGNAGAGTVVSDFYAVDTIRPTAVITLDTVRLGPGDTAQVTIAFSDYVTGLDSDDLDVPNGTLDLLTSTDGGATWTATLTPAASTFDDTNVITLDTTGVQSASGNAGEGTATSENYVVATVVVRPVDVTPPSSRADGPQLSATRTWTIDYAAADADSGVVKVDLYVRAPGETAYTKVDTATDETGELTYTATGDGAYEFHTLATDRAGNVEAAPAGPDVTTLVDTTAPESQASGPRLVGSRTWSIGYASTDTGSGVATVDLWVRTPGETAYTKVDTADGPAGELTYTAAADGTYEFHTVATDRADNAEDAPATPDVSTLVDTRAPSIRAVGPTPWMVDLGSGALRMRFRVGEDADVSVRILQRREPVRAYRTRSVAAGVLAVRWAGRDDGGARVQPGRYRVVVVAEDAAGNRTRASVPLRVKR